MDSKNALYYTKYWDTDNIITIDLHNGYSVIAIILYWNKVDTFNVQLMLKENSIDRWELVEKAEHLTFKINKISKNAIFSAILKQVSTFLEEGFFDYYINRYKNYQSCIDASIDFISEDIGNTSAS